MFLVAGLGNPGSACLNTRHNVGFMLVDRMASRPGSTPWTRIGRSLVCRTRIRSESVVLAKPQTFMNRSGEAIARLVESTAIDLAHLLVVFDDVSLPFGKIRIRPSGSSGGQKGMESVVRAFNSEEVPRLRIGIAPEIRPVDLSDFVLGPFDPSEQAQIGEVLQRAEEAVRTVVGEGLEKAMSLFNQVRM